jgi:NADP-dependent 3-hydroxy acid dehydrogenase YdfG
MSSKIVVITGASSGIGTAVARRLAADGHHVILGARRVDRLEALVSELHEAGHKAGHAALDVTDPESVKTFVEDAHRRHGRIDVLVNNAGVMPLSRLDDVRVDDWNQMIDVNIKGLLHAVAAVLPLMKAQGHGHLIGLSSALAHFVAPATSVYSATKYASRDLRRPAQGERRDQGDRDQPGLHRVRTDQGRRPRHHGVGAVDGRPVQPSRDHRRGRDRLRDRPAGGCRRQRNHHPHTHPARLKA